MKNYDWQSAIFVSILCVVICFGLQAMTKFVDQHADKHYQVKKGK